jgi:hypothetical protein
MREVSDLKELFQAMKAPALAELAPAASRSHSRPEWLPFGTSA